MALSADELITLIDKEAARWKRGDDLAMARHGMLLHLREVLQRTGFPHGARSVLRRFPGAVRVPGGQL